MSFRGLLAIIAPRIFAPKGPPNAERLARSQQRSLVACTISTLFVAVFAVVSIILGGLTIDRVTIIMMVLITTTLLLTVKQLIIASQLWRDMAIRLQNDGFEPLSNHVDFVLRYQEASKIPDAISLVPEGWMFSFGMMNVSRHNRPNRTGPTAFLWRPDIVLKDGKVESRAVSGEGDTLEQALLDAIEQANKISYPPVPA